MDNYNTPNSGCCGRPMHYATGPKCGQNHCCFNEYDYKASACIRKKQPDCAAQAVIPAITVETTFGLNSYTNCFVHVTGNNTTYYVDDKGTPIITWKGDVETQLPDDINSNDSWEDFLKSFDLKSQFLYVKLYNSDDDRYYIEVFYYDSTGKIYLAGEFKDVIMGDNNGDIH